MTKKNYEYSVSWNGKMARYRQVFESLEEARMALALHHHKDAVLHIKQLD